MTDSYETCRDQLCVACAKQLSVDDLEDYADIYTDTTVNGKSLLEMIKTIVGQDIQPSTYSTKICHSCLKVIN